MSVNRKVTVPPGAACDSVIRARSSSSVVGRFGQLAQPCGKPAQDRQRDAWLFEQDGLEVPRGKGQAGRRPDGDDLGVARLAVEDRELAEEIARPEAGDRLAAAHDPRATAAHDE